MWPGPLSVDSLAFTEDDSSIAGGWPAVTVALISYDLLDLGELGCLSMLVGLGVFLSGMELELLKLPCVCVLLLKLPCFGLLEVLLALLWWSIHSLSALITLFTEG